MNPWFWSWVAVAVASALGEAVTGGLFVLPWAIGAALAAILDALGAGLGWEWLAFIGVSSVLLVVAQRVKLRRK